MGPGGRPLLDHALGVCEAVAAAREVIAAPGTWRECLIYGGK